MNAGRPPDQLDTVDEFEEFDNDEFNEDPLPPPQSFKDRILTLWHDNPGFKMLVILGIGAVVLLCAYLFMSSSNKPSEATPSHVTSSDSNVKGTPGANVSAEYKKILDESNKKTAMDALKTGGSAIPTPVGNVVDNTPVKKEDPVDPLQAWRQADIKPLPPAPAPVVAQQPAPAPVPAAPQPNPQIAQQQQINDQYSQQITNAMQTQIGSLLQAWGPTSATVVTFTQPTRTTTNTTITGVNGTTISGASADAITPGANVVAPGLTGAGPTAINSTSTTTTTTPGGSATTTQTVATRAKVIVPAGDIHYGAMITEANSDVPGPILAQISSGVLKGGRVIGTFESTGDYLILRFSTLSIHGQSYAIDAIALDPNTTLGAVATETDQRYFSRLVLPAAAAFISQFGQAISTPSTTTSQNASTTVTTTQPSSTSTALYAGLGQSAQQLSSFVNAAGNQVRPLVRVASSTAIGIFFIKPVTDQPQGQ